MQVFFRAFLNSTNFHMYIKGLIAEFTVNSVVPSNLTFLGMSISLWLSMTIMMMNGATQISNRKSTRPVTKESYNMYNNCVIMDWR